MFTFSFQVAINRQKRERKENVSVIKIYNNILYILHFNNNSKSHILLLSALCRIAIFFTDQQDCYEDGTAGICYLWYA